MGRFSRPPAGVLRQAASAAQRPYHQAYESGDAYTSGIQSAGEEAPDKPIVVRNVRYGGEGFTAGLGESPSNRYVYYTREQRTQVMHGTRQRPNMHDPIADGPFRAAVRWVNFALRKEYLQDAARFSGLHTSHAVDIAQSGTSGRRTMVPPRQNRLTVRAEPRSYGSQTKKIA